MMEIIISNKIVPALRFNFLTKYYDFLVAITTKEDEIRTLMASKIHLKDNDSVLDIACGTGTFLSLLSRYSKDTELVGLDADQNVLELANIKNNAGIKYVNGYSNSLPFEDNTFDYVCSSLFFHHIGDKIKNETLSEINRVLKPTGKFVFSDWDQPKTIYEKSGFLVVRLLDGFKVTEASKTGKIGSILKNQFPNIIKTDSLSVPLGRISIWTTETPARLRV